MLVVTLVIKVRRVPASPCQESKDGRITFQLTINGIQYKYQGKIFTALGAIKGSCKSSKNNNGTWNASPVGSHFGIN
jgi:hypothetical protein